MARYLVNDANRVDARAKLTTAVISTLIGLQATEKKYIKASSDASVTILKDTVICVGDSIFKTERDIVLNSTALDTGSFEVGKDYYIYVCDKGSGQDEEYKISLNSTFPLGYNAVTSRKIGGFHYGDVRRTKADTLEPINTSGVAWGNGWEDNVYQGILPFSVWTLLHRPVADVEGMVYCESIGKWVDIYLTSTNYKSEYNATAMTGSEGLMYYDWHEKVARKTKKHPLSYLEFCSVADGSPNGRDDSNTYAWSHTSNSGRNKTGIIAKAVSSYGLKDCVGNVWEVGRDVSFSTQIYTGSGGAWNFKNATEVKKGAHYTAFNNDVHVTLHGGNWYAGASCGSRTVYCSDFLWNVNTHVGCRLACDSL
jgi:formylglycine-generating enzyme required for sulfatase activity